LSERLPTSIEYSIEKQLKINDSKLIKLQNTDESDGSELSEEIRDVAHSNIKKNNQNSY